MKNLPGDGAAGTWGSFGGGVGVQVAGCSSTYGNNIVYHSPCGQTDQEDKSYDKSVNYWTLTKGVCSYLASAGKLKKDKEGFDPDFKDKFFPDSEKGDVFHEFAY